MMHKNPLAPRNRGLFHAAKITRPDRSRERSRNHANGTIPVLNCADRSHAALPSVAARTNPTVTISATF
jgi:hypothetical protein